MILTWNAVFATSNDSNSYFQLLTELHDEILKAKSNEEIIDSLHKANSSRNKMVLNRDAVLETLSAYTGILATKIDSEVLAKTNAGYLYNFLDEIRHFFFETTGESKDMKFMGQG